ncbi:MAG: protease modulator HflC [Nitrospirae bacterium]|nr:protease modulator HflC [Magnetococcales bacterium]HAT49735.1 protease modulator HflC [Alphaproteobacteria bacterium]
MNFNPRFFLFVLALFALWLLSATLYVVGETQQALVIRFGAPVVPVHEPGLKAKLPLIDRVIYYDARLLTLELPTEQVILGDQKRIEVQTYTRYRIVDPLRFYQALRTREQAEMQLAQLVSSSLRRELGQVMLRALLSDERPHIVERIYKEVAGQVRDIGIAVVEVRFHRADLPLETSQAIYDRMKSERQREAKELRAQGFEWAQQIQAKADRERTVILSGAQRQARITRGQADAEANRLLSGAFDKDPQFYRFYRSLQTYRHALAESGPTIMLSPDTEFLRSLTAGPGVVSGR